MEAVPPRPRVAVPTRVAVAAEAAPTGQGVPVPSEGQALAVLDSFSGAYGRGDLTALMRLFADDARNNTGGRVEIAADYRGLFNGSRERALVLKPIGTIVHTDGRVTVLARYTSRVLHTGHRRATRTEGDIRFELSPTLKIRQILHDED